MPTDCFVGLKSSVRDRHLLAQSDLNIFELFNVAKAFGPRSWHRAFAPWIPGEMDEQSIVAWRHRSSNARSY